MGGSSGGGGGQQTTTQEFKPPDWTVPGWQAMVAGATQYASKPYQPFDGMRVAPINGSQQQGLNFIEDRALTGAPDLNSARGMAYNMTQGNFANPWGSNVSGIAQGYAYNPWSEQTAGMAQKSNPYTSDDYTNQIIRDTAEQMAQGYATGQAAQIDSAANMAGNFGGGGWQALHNAGAQGLEKQIGQMASQTLQDQQRFKSGAYNQDFANQMQALGLGTQQYMGDVSNQLQANQQGAGIYSNDINAMLQGGQLAGQLSQDDWIAGQQLMNSGNMQNQYVQNLLNTQYNDWTAAQQYPAQMLDILGSALGRASGSYGSSFTAAQQPGINPLMGILGLGATGYGLFGG